MVKKTKTKEEKTELEKRLLKLEKEKVIPSEKESEKTRIKFESDPKNLEKKELTQEQKDILEERKKENEKIALDKKKKVYEMFQQGAFFMKFIYDDLEKQKKENLNRPQRRKFEKDLKKGIFSKELIQVYAAKIDVALDWIEKRSTPVKKVINKEVK